MRLSERHGTSQHKATPQPEVDLVARAVGVLGGERGRRVRDSGVRIHAWMQSGGAAGREVAGKDNRCHTAVCGLVERATGCVIESSHCRNGNGSVWRSQSA